MRTDRPASDAQMREVVAQLADAAPPAPEWWRVTSDAPAPARGPSRLVLAAAAILLVVAGVLLTVRRPPSDQGPAETPPISPVVPLDLDDRFALWLRASDPLAVQLCITQVASNLIADGDLPPADLTTADVPDWYAPLTWYRTQQQPLATLPFDIVPPTIAGVIAAWDALEAGQFSDGGSPAPDFDELLDTFGRRRDAAMRPTSSGCLLADPATRVELGLSPIDPVGTVRCLNATRAAHALALADNDPATWAATGAESLVAAALSNPRAADEDDLRTVRDALDISTPIPAAATERLLRSTGADCRPVVLAIDTTLPTGGS